MRYPSKDIIDSLRREFPEGCRVELLEMDDPQAPSIGTRGIVQLIDSMATIHVRWDTGCGLGVAYGADRCRRCD